jgi:hypothetical protein
MLADRSVTWTPRALTAKLIDDHLVSEEREPGVELGLRVDQVLIEGATGTMAALQFEQLGAERSAVALALLYIDHNVHQIDWRKMDDHHYLQAFCSRYGWASSCAAGSRTHGGGIGKASLRFPSPKVFATSRSGSLATAVGSPPARGRSSTWR